MHEIRVNDFLLTNFIYLYTLNHASMLFRMYFFFHLTLTGLMRTHCALTIDIITYRILNHRDAYALSHTLVIMTWV